MTAFLLPKTVRAATYTAPGNGGLFVDTLTANRGYVTAGYVGSESGYGRLKFQVRHGDRVYNYDFNYKPRAYPINMGSGDYLFRFMERVEGNTYAEVKSVSKRVKLTSATVPYSMPSVYCDYDVDGPCVRMARLLCATCKTDLEALNAVCKWTSKSIVYDYDKAKRLSGSSGYVPSPDQTITSRRGVCFDYASVTAAMLRSVGIPCKVVVGYVDDVYYHAWVSAYVGERWRRRDPTFMGAGKKAQKYERKYVY